MQPLSLSFGRRRKGIGCTYDMPSGGVPPRLLDQHVVEVQPEAGRVIVEGAGGRAGDGTRGEGEPVELGVIEAEAAALSVHRRIGVVRVGGERHAPRPPRHRHVQRRPPALELRRVEEVGQVAELRDTVRRGVSQRVSKGHNRLRSPRRAASFRAGQG